MSLLRASGLRCHIRPLRISRLADRCTPVPLTRRYSNNASYESQDPEWVGSPIVRYENAGLMKRFVFAATRPGLFTISKEVMTAMEEMKPILGLETAIYTHGFPKPDNYQLALEMEEMARQHGAVPATIGILNGKILIGMEPEQLKELTESAGSENTHKISRRDLAYHIGAAGPLLNGGTTIAGTILISSLTGIRVIATGGLGGVHKGGENSLDISADLTELSRNQIAVVTSGMKSFLDTPRTMEFLETQGVFVSTFGNKTEKVDIPGFFSRESGYPSPYVVESPEEAARIFFANGRLELGSGNLFFNPIPEEYEIPKSEMDPIIASAVEKSSSITGKDNTPAVLNEIVKQTEGRSIEANRQLVLNNAKVGAQLVVELQRLEKVFIQGKWAYGTELKAQDAARGMKRVPPKKKKFNGYISAGGTNGLLRTSTSNQETSHNPTSGRRNLWTLNQAEPGDSRLPETPDPEEALEEQEENEDTHGDIDIGALPETGGILVVGGVGVDVVGKSANGDLLARTSNPGVITFTVGGVGKNVAATIRQLDPPGPVRFLSTVGKDMNGIAVFQELKSLDLSVENIKVRKGARTACYAALNSISVKGGLSAAVADMNIITRITGEDIRAAIEKYKPKIVCFDGNLHSSAMKELCKAAKENGALVVCEPTSIPKSEKIARMFVELGLELDHPIDIISPNSDELKGIAEVVQVAYHYMTTFQPTRSEIKVKLEAKAKKYKDMLEHHTNTINRVTAALHTVAQRNCQIPSKFPRKQEFRDSITRSVGLLPFVHTVITKLGEEGVISVRLIKHPNPVEGAVRSRYTAYHNVRDERKHHGQQGAGEGKVVVDCFLPAEPYNTEDQIVGIHIMWARAARLLKDSHIVSSNGAGDTFLGGLLHGMMQKSKWSEANIIASPWKYLEGEQLEILVDKAQKAAVRTLMSNASHPLRNEDSLELDDDVKEKQGEEIWTQAVGEFEEILVENDPEPKDPLEKSILKNQSETKGTEAITKETPPAVATESSQEPIPKKKKKQNKKKKKVVMNDRLPANVAQSPPQETESESSTPDIDTPNTLSPDPSTPTTPTV
ncbi:hypothetical protein TWF281_009371 [Arthrobotrys megalospora]